VRHFDVEEADSRLEPVRTLLEGFTERMLCDRLPPTVRDLRRMNDRTFIEILRSAGADGIRDALRHIYYRESFFLLGHATVTRKPPLTQPRSQVQAALAIIVAPRCAPCVIYCTQRDLELSRYLSSHVPHSSPPNVLISSLVLVACPRSRHTKSSPSPVAPRIVLFTKPHREHPLDACTLRHPPRRIDAKPPCVIKAQQQYMHRSSSVH
jgi:hypothetical protein